MTKFKTVDAVDAFHDVTEVILVFNHQDTKLLGLIHTNDMSASGHEQAAIHAAVASSITAFAVMPKGVTMLIASYAQTHNVKLTNPRTFSISSTCSWCANKNCHYHEISHDPDQGVLVMATTCTVNLYDLQQGTLVRELALPMQSGAMQHVCCIPGKRLAILFSMYEIEEDQLYVMNWHGKIMDVNRLDGVKGAWKLFCDTRLNLIMVLANNGSKWSIHTFCGESFLKYGVVEIKDTNTRVSPWRIQYSQMQRLLFVSWMQSNHAVLTDVTTGERELIAMPRGQHGAIRGPFLYSAVRNSSLSCSRLEVVERGNRTPLGAFKSTIDQSQIIELLADESRVIMVTTDSVNNVFHIFE